MSLSCDYLIIAFFCLHTSSWGDGATYKAAVLEFAPTIGNQAANLVQFIQMIEQAHLQKCDIIVFPEMGLNGYGPCHKDMTTYVPHPVNKIAPYKDPDTYSKALVELSNAAKDNKIYVVVNVAEIASCEPGEGCPKTGLLRYNTNVAFDRQGVVIARYRKFNLFGEIGTNRTSYPELSYFDTDFGVRFGMFICFDLLFDKPTNQLVKQLNIHDFVYSTAWFSELPFLTAVQAQHMWSYTQDVNFLGSGYNDPSVGSGGSGIYRGRDGPILMELPDNTTTKLIIADLPILQQSRGDHKPINYLHTDGFSIPPKETMNLKTENLAAYISKPIEDLIEATKLCHEQFCCEFKINVNKTLANDPYRYRALVFDGVRTFDGVATGGVQACAISMCWNDTSTGCGVRGYSDTLFTTIDITGTFDISHGLPMPSTLRDDSQLLPMLSDEFSFKSQCNKTTCDIAMSLTKTAKHLNTFGIYSRNYARDGEPVTVPKDNGAATFVPLILSLLSPILVCYVISLLFR